MTATLDDYLRVFAQYGKEVEFIYLETGDDRYEILFEQIMKLLVLPSQFNLGLPEPFRRTAFRYKAGDVDTVAQLADRETRLFLICEVYDFIMLNGGLARRRATGGGEKSSG